jgi:hypothetical protein
MSPRGKSTEIKPKPPSSLQRHSTIKRAAMLGLKVAGGISWILAYREAIRDAQETGQGELPGPAIAFNLVWEITYTAGGITKWRQLDLEDRIQTALNAAWLSCDLKLCYQLREELKSKKLAFLSAGVYNAIFLALFPPEEAARITAFWQNFGFSAYAALFQSNTAGTASASQRFTLMRTIGTAIPTVTSGLGRGINPAYLIPGIGCACFDLIKLGKGHKILRKTKDEL